MAKKQKSFIKNLIVISLLVFNVIFSVALFFAFAAQFLPPSVSLFVAYCGLLFPYLLLANLLFVFIWLFLHYQYALISLVCILININNIDRYYQMKGLDKPEKCACCIKVMSYNAKLFGLYNSPNPAEQKRQKEEIMSMLRDERPDILCMQEYFVDKSNKLDFHTTDSILSILHLDDSKKCYYQYLPLNLNHAYYYGLAIFSKYKIIRADYVHFNDSSSNKAVFVDIRYKNDTIRIYNVHLNSIRMDASDYEIGKQIAKKNVDDPKLNVKAKKLYKKIGKAFVGRQQQANILRHHIDSCLYPVIICGDFNDSPSSYCYHKVAHGFRDSFRQSGAGKGTTYYGDAFPAYRIDFILHEKKYNDFGHTVLTNVKTSDHYPIYTYISLINK